MYAGTITISCSALHPKWVPTSLSLHHPQPCLTSDQYLHSARVHLIKTYLVLPLYPLHYAPLFVTGCQLVIMVSGQLEESEVK